MFLKESSNALLNIIQKSGLDPTLFEGKTATIETKTYFIIKLRNTSIRFAVRSTGGDFNSFICRTSVLTPPFPLGKPHPVPSPQHLYDKFDEWLNSVAKVYLDDLNSPDLWQMLESTRSDVMRETEAPDYSESFSEEDKVQLRLSINEFRLLVVNNFNPNKEELAAINDRLEYLSAAMDKHNKFDWKGIAIHTVITIIVTLALNPEQSQQLFQLFKQVFSNIIYLLP